VAGVSLDGDGNDRAFLWTPERGMEDLGTLGGPTSAADGISETGEVVGVSSTVAGTEEAFLWTRGRGMRSLGSLDGRAHSFGNDVNSAHLVVGGSFDTDSIIAHFWTPHGGLVPLPTPGGARGLPEDVNELGQIVGNFETADGRIHATLLVPIGDAR
jgi:probable HAF family extracellular repeat protein